MISHEEFRIGPLLADFRPGHDGWGNTEMLARLLDRDYACLAGEELTVATLPT